MLRISCAYVMLVLLFVTNSSSAQAVSQEKSAKAAAMSDTRFIAANIEDNEGAMFLSQKGIERAADARVKELAELMKTDHTSILYEFEQLQVAAGNQKATTAADKQTAEAYAKLSLVSGGDFDTLWVSSLLVMQQEKYDELSQAKETVMNPQLKMVITRALPLIRKHVSQLKVLQKYLIKMDMQRKKEEEKRKRDNA